MRSAAHHQRARVIGREPTLAATCARARPLAPR